MIVSALGGAERRVARIERQDFPISGVLLPTKIDWSPDGRFIALGSATVSLLNLETGELIPLTSASSVGYDRDPAFSADSRAVAYSRGDRYCIDRCGFSGLRAMAARKGHHSCCIGRLVHSWD
jgi:WD40 repeat protein